MAVDDDAGAMLLLAGAMAVCAMAGFAAVMAGAGAAGVVDDEVDGAEDVLPPSDEF